MRHVVIVGGGQSAFQVAASLRQYGFDGAITLVSKERRLPYQRPPLSKDFLTSLVREEQLYFRPEEWYEANDIHVRLASEITYLDRVEKCVGLATQEVIGYDTLVLATGSIPRRLPGISNDLGDVCCLSTLNDAIALRDRLSRASSVAVIGGGFIGLEVAATARALGLSVVVVEAGCTVLTRVVGPVVSEHIARLHRSQGVDLRTGVAVEALKLTDGMVTGMSLSDGSAFATELVVIGIGSIPNTHLAEAAGLRCDNGIVVDDEGRTSDANIFAAGDCCLRFHSQYQRWLRLESVHNAIEQAKVVATSIARNAPPRPEVPWFWSDQFGTKLQIAGLSTGADDYVVKGDPCGRHFSVLHFKNECLTAIEAVNCPQDFAVGRKLIGAGAVVDRTKINEEGVSLKAFLPTNKGAAF